MNFLRPATEIWGNATLIESDPAEEFCRDSIYVPLSQDVYFDGDPDWGIYHPDGHIVQSAAYYRGSDHHLVGQSHSTGLDPTSLETIDEEFIYGGPIILHYGHFLTATLARLWHLASAPRPKRLRILCHAHQIPAHWFEHGYVRDSLLALGLTPDDFVTLDHPCIIRRLRVFRPAVEEQNFIHRTMQSLCSRIGRFHGVHRESQDHHPVYFSKTRLTTGITRFMNEEVLEAHLAARGVTIVHPQEYSFAEQLRILSRASVLTGTAGSVFHGSLFLNRPSRIVALAHGAINANFILVDRLMGNHATYLIPGINAEEIKDNPAFQSSWLIDMPRAAADFADYLFDTAS